jgi:hypothetical protein
MGLYQSSRKAETGFGSDMVLRKFTPAEIKNSVKQEEATGLVR